MFGRYRVLMARGIAQSLRWPQRSSAPFHCHFQLYINALCLQNDAAPHSIPRRLWAKCDRQLRLGDTGSKSAENRRQFHKRPRASYDHRSRQLRQKERLAVGQIGHFVDAVDGWNERTAPAAIKIRSPRTCSVPICSVCALTNAALPA